MELMVNLDNYYATDIMLPVVIGDKQDGFFVCL